MRALVEAATRPKRALVTRDMEKRESFWLGIVLGACGGVAVMMSVMVWAAVAAADRIWP